MYEVGSYQQKYLQMDLSDFLLRYVRSLSFEEEKVHASYRLVKVFLSLVPGGLSEGKFIAPPQCMPDQFTLETESKIGQLANNSNSEITCRAYRKYYQYKFDTGIAEYNWNRGKPDWIAAS